MISELGPEDVDEIAETLKKEGGGGRFTRNSKV